MTQIELAPLPPREAIEFFRSKGLAPTLQRFDWRDHWREEHARAFVVAKAMNDDVLQTIRDAIDRALADGTTFETFVDELQPQLEAYGWWGKQIDRDPLTGEIKEVQLGSRHRLKVMFDTNWRTAYAAGQWARIWRVRDAFPYLEYNQIDRPTKRHDHSRFHGLIRPVEDPIWQRIFPPNGWFCGCWVRPLTRGMLAREGKTLSPPLDLDEQPYENRRTGETEPLPSGIYPGFDTNPGALWLNLRDQHDASALDLSPSHDALDRGLVSELRARAQRDRGWHLGVYDMDALPEDAVLGYASAASSAPIHDGFMLDDPDRNIVEVLGGSEVDAFGLLEVQRLHRSPGLAQVVAVATDGSIYRMSAPRAGRVASVQSVWDTTQSALEAAIGGGELSLGEANALRQHLFSLAIARSELAAYAYALSGARQDVVDRKAGLIARILSAFR